VRRLATTARLDDTASAEVQATAKRLVQAVRHAPASKSGLDAFLRQYDLSSQGRRNSHVPRGGIAQDSRRRNRRPPDRDKLKAGDWASHLGTASPCRERLDLGLMTDPAGSSVSTERRRGAIERDLARRRPHGEPVVRTAMRQAMRIMGHQFVMGRTIAEALDNSLTAGTAAIATRSTCSARRP